MSLILLFGSWQGQSIGQLCLNRHRDDAWGYSEKNGPEHWAEISKRYLKCQFGEHQSPINIHPDEIPLVDSSLDFKYKASKIDLIDNEHTIEFDYDHGSVMIFEGLGYELKQFHFHSPSEHDLEGKEYDMEIHLVHKNKSGRLAVLALWVKEGKENQIIKPVWRHLPNDKNKHHLYKKEKFAIYDLLPQDKQAYYYSGSLTTPPCSEKVNWLVLKEPIEMSKHQIDIFHEHYNWNNRALQVL